MTLVITPNKRQALSIKQQLSLLALPSNKRIRILKTLGRHERKKARDRIRQQTTVTGQKFAPRSNGRKGKMLKRLGRTLEPFVKGAKRLELKHKAGLTGRIAALHQQGGVETMTANRMARIHGKPDYKAPATRSQAKALRQLGFKVPKKKGKGYRSATITEIMRTLSQGKAGEVLKVLRDKKTKQRWPIEVEARPFLGDSTQAVQTQLSKIIQQVSR